MEEEDLHTQLKHLNYWQDPGSLPSSMYLQCEITHIYSMEEDQDTCLSILSK